MPLARGGPDGLTTLLIVTCGGAGLSPFAPGTFGTFAAWALAWVLNLPHQVWLAVGFAAFALGIVYTDRAHAATGSEDPGWIVIDEAAAWWVCYGVLGGELPMQAAIFLIFRMFDIAKPPPVRWIDRRFRNGFGVMADDLAAAGWTIAVLLLLRPYIAA